MVCTNCGEKEDLSANNLCGKCEKRYQSTDKLIILKGKLVYISSLCPNCKERMVARKDLLCKTCEKKNKNGQVEMTKLSRDLLKQKREKMRLAIIIIKEKLKEIEDVMGF